MTTETSTPTDEDDRARRARRVRLRRDAIDRQIQSLDDRRAMLVRQSDKLTDQLDALEATS